MRRTQLLVSILLLLGFSIGIGCSRLNDLSKDLEDVKGVKWSPEFALPLVNSTLELSDLISTVGTEFIDVDDQRLIHLIYRGDLLSLRADKLLAIDDQRLSSNISFNSAEIAEFSTNDSVSKSSEFILFYDLEYDEIDSMIMKVLEMVANFNSSFNHDSKITIELPHVTKNGESFSYSLTMSNGASHSGTADLSGYKIDMTQGPTGYNELIIRIKTTVVSSGVSILQPSDEISFNLDFNENKFARLFGYIGVEELVTKGADTLRLKIFENANNGSFTVTDPRVKLVFLNSYGIPVEAKLKQFKAMSDQSGIVDITGFPSDINIPLPTMSQIGEVLKDSIVLNKSTSNIGAVVSSQPEKIIYELDASTNPRGKEQENFALDSSTLTFRLDLDIPLSGTADGFRLEQEQAFDFDFGESVNLEYFVFRLYLENEFPVDLDFQIYFLDDNDVVIDSLISPRDLFIESPPVDTDGRSLDKTITIHDVKYTKDRIDKIQHATKYKIDALINTFKDGTSQPTVSFFEDYGLKVQLGVAAKILVEGSLGE